jgi:hypothetical protein
MLLAQTTTTTTTTQYGPLQIVNSIIGLVGLICFILVVVKMFQNGQTGLGITCILTFCICIGYLIAFVVGWINSGKWNIKLVMIIWTLCFIVSIILSAISPPSTASFSTTP